MWRKLGWLVSVTLLGGCSITQDVKPVTLDASAPREICVVENPDVRSEFLDAYVRALSNRNLTVRRIPQGSSVSACPLTTTYTANWSWDLALYLVYADLKVYSDGRPQGEALYSSRNGGLNMGKFIQADTKIQELVAQLFPKS